MPSISTAASSDRRPRGGMVHVRAHTRDSGKVQVDAYDRKASPSSATTAPEPSPARADDGPTQGSLPSAQMVEEELPKALRIEAVQQAEPGPIRRIVMDAQARATLNMAALGIVSPIAQRLYWHYLDCSGTDIWFSRDEARSLRPVAEAEKAVERAFVRTTLSGATKDGKVARFLRSIPEGTTVSLPLSEAISIAGIVTPVFDHNVRTRLGRTAIREGLRAPGDYLIVGQTSVTGGLTDGTARREGGKILLQGTVRFGLNDQFDFRQDQPGGWEGVMLERYAIARPFTMRAQWDRKLVSLIRVGRDRAGNLVFEPEQITWIDIE
jgi:hypothetical protein